MKLVKNIRSHPFLIVLYKPLSRIESVQVFLPARFSLALNDCCVSASLIFCGMLFHTIGPLYLTLFRPYSLLYLMRE